MLLDTVRQDILEHAKHLSPITTEAQMYLESGYRPGQEISALASPPNHNLFGIKANDKQFTDNQKGMTWNWFDTKEWDGKKWISIKDKFRIYQSYEASIKDHDNFFVSTPSRIERYRKTREAASLEQEIVELGKSGYATDPDYSDKIRNMIKAYKIDEKYDINKIAKFNKKGNDKMAKLTLEQAFTKLGLKFKKQLLPLTKTYGRVNRKQGTVVHQTGAPQANKTAQWMADYQKSMSSSSNPEEKSWNYQVDDKEVIMSFEHNVATWQSSDGRGPGNMAHISIESCINAGADYAKGIDNLAKTMAVIAYIEGFNIESDTKRHYDFARDKKWCPAQIMNGKEGFTYAKVKQMAQAHLNTLNGAKAKPVDVHNPQNLTESKPLDYKAPRLPFETLKLGDKATLLDDKNSNGDYIWLWYNPTNNTLLKSKRQEELAGTTDTIKEVKKIDKIQHSQYAYLLKDTNSWILEEYLEEPRKNWEVVEVENEDKVENGKEVEPLKDGQFWWNDVLYQINEVK